MCISTETPIISKTDTIPSVSSLSWAIDTHWRIATVRRWNLHLGPKYIFEKDFCDHNGEPIILSGVLNGISYQKIGNPQISLFVATISHPFLDQHSWVSNHPSETKLPNWVSAKFTKVRSACDDFSSTKKPPTPGLVKGKYVPANSENCSQGRLPEEAFPEPESVTKKTYQKEQEQ